MNVDKGGISSNADKSQWESGTPREGQHPLIRTVVLAILVGVAFHLSAKLGLAFRFKPDFIAVFWPPNTIILTALVLAPPRRWWIYLLAMLPAYFAAVLEAGQSEQRAVVFFIADCTEVLFAAVALRRILRKPPRFDHLREVGVFVVFVVLAAPFVSASIASMVTFRESVPYGTVWRVWFLGDSLAHLALTPVLLTWVISRKDWFRDISIPRYAEAGGLTLGLIAVSHYAFGGEVGSYGSLPALVYTPLPLLLWAAIRFGPRGSCSATLIVTMLAIWNAVNGRGPFTALDPAESVLSLQLFFMVISIPMMFLAAFVQEHYKAALALRESEARYARAVAGANDGIWDWNIETGEDYFSPRWEEIVGHGPGEIEPVAHNFSELVHADDLDHFWAAVGDHLEHRVPFDIEFRLRHRSGDYIWVRARGQATWDENGTPSRMAGSITDITERKGAEDRLRSYFNMPLVGVAFYNPELEWIEVSDALCDMFGYERPEFMEMTWADVTHPDDLDQNTQLFEQALAGDLDTYSMDKRFIRKNGEIIHASISVQCLRHPDGSPDYFILLVKDISERKRAEREIHELNENLELRVEERTIELRAAQAALLRKERLATLGQLTGTVAHEIRNPLGTIANSISVIKHKCSEAGLDLETILDRTSRSIRRCDRIITELLDFARARGLQSQPTALDTWLSDILEEQHVPEGIAIKSDFQINGIAVNFDPDELRRAVINVIDNACQAMVDRNGENGTAVGGQLTIASRLIGERVEIRFVDDGPGIPEEILPQVLEPLFSTKAFGTGLGLPIVQRIMEAHGGGVEISSEEGHGTRVVLWLPQPDGREGVSR